MFKLFLAWPRVIFINSLQMLNKKKWHAWTLLGWSRFCHQNSFLQKQSATPSNSKNSTQTGESSIQTIILPQSLSDWQYLGDTGYHKLSFSHWHLEVSKHLSAWETDVLSFLKTIWRCGSSALFVWLLCSELILFPWLSLCDIKVFQALVLAHLLISSSWLQNCPFCKPSIIVKYGLPLNIYRNCTLAPLCVSLVPFVFYTTNLFSNTVE